MLKNLALSYSELLLITTHYSWIVKKKKKKKFLTNSHFSFLSHFSLLSSLPNACGSAMVFFFFSLIDGPMVTVQCSWVMVVGHSEVSIFFKFLFLLLFVVAVDLASGWWG